jgi:hypothetical protein
MRTRPSERGVAVVPQLRATAIDPVVLNGGAADDAEAAGVEPGIPLGDGLEGG